MKCVKGQQMKLFIALLTLTASLLAMEPLVTPQWLNEHLGDADLRVVEVSHIKSYEKEHIPHAVHTDISEWRFDNGTFLSVKEVKEIEKVISNLGIEKHSNVVLYAPIHEPKDLLKASYIYWVLNYHGVANVALLDGGLEQWKKVGLEVTANIDAPKKTNFTASIDSSKITDLQYVSQNIKKLPMIDARPSDKYLGINATPTVKRHGHISGAMSYSWNYSVNDDYMLKPKEQLQAVFKDGYNLDKNQEIIVYCTGGLETSFNYYVLSGILGYKNIKLYDASMKEYGNREDTLMTQYRYEMFN